MKHLTFYLDFTSAHAHLAFAKLPVALLGLSYSVAYKPVLLGAIRRCHEPPNPVEIPDQRARTQRRVEGVEGVEGIEELAKQQQPERQRPTPQPYPSRPLLRLALACQPNLSPSRFVCEALFRYVWQGGGSPLDPARWQALSSQLAPQMAPNSRPIKAKLRAYTKEALAQGAFDVPGLCVDDQLFCGPTALPRLDSYLRSAARGRA